MICSCLARVHWREGDVPVRFRQNHFTSFAGKSIPVSGTVKSASTLIMDPVMPVLLFSTVQFAMSGMWHPQSTSHTQIGAAKLMQLQALFNLCAEVHYN